MSSLTSTVGRQAAQGVVWVFLAMAASRALGFGTNLVLARLLDPSSFGLFSFVMVAINGLNLLQDLGVGAAVVYGKRPPAVVGGTALAINMVVAVTFAVLAVLGAPFIAQAANQPEVRGVMMVLACTFVITALGSVQDAYLIKELSFHRRFIPDVGSAIASGVLSIVLALLGFGVWSLVFGYLGRTIASTALLWYASSMRPLLTFSWSTAKELLRYGRHVSLSSCIAFAVSNIDYVVIGRVLGSHDLGVYTMAFIIANLFGVMYQRLIPSVAFPAFSRLREDHDALVSTFLDSLRIVLLLAALPAIGLVLLTPAYATLVLGEKWSEIVQPLQILAVYAVIRCVEANFAPALKAVGRPDGMWLTGGAKLAVAGPLIVLAAPYGITAVALAQLVSSVIFYPVSIFWNGRLMRIEARAMAQISVPALVGSALVGCILVWAYVTPFGYVLLNDYVGSLVLTTAALAAYLTATLALEPRLLSLGRYGLAVVRARVSPAAA